MTQINLRNRYLAEKADKATAETITWIPFGKKLSARNAKMFSILQTSSNKEIGIILQSIAVDIHDKKLALVHNNVLQQAIASIPEKQYEKVSAQVLALLSKK